MVVENIKQLLSNIIQLFSSAWTYFDEEDELKAFEDSKAGVRGLVESGVSKIPRIFHTGKLDITENSSIDSKLRIPIIDLKNIHANPFLRVQVIDQIRSACHEWGFFQVINHGIPVTVLDGMIDGIRRFHEQDPDVRKEFYTGRRYDSKEKIIKYYSNAQVFDWRDTFSFRVAPGTLEPKVLPPICRYCASVFAENNGFGFTIFELLSEALGLDPSYLKELNCAEALFIMGHYYPPCPEPELTMGSNKHTDSNFMTLLLQDQIGGLQVLHNDKWVNVPPVHGALVVNIGGLLQLITNDMFVSVYHRVLSQNIGPRISVASFFVNVTSQGKGASKVYGPIKELLSEENPRIYKDVTQREFLIHFFSSLEPFKL